MNVITRNENTARLAAALTATASQDRRSAYRSDLNAAGDRFARYSGHRYTGTPLSTRFRIA